MNTGWTPGRTAATSLQPSSAGPAVHIPHKRATPQHSRLLDPTEKTQASLKHIHVRPQGGAPAPIPRPPCSRGGGGDECHLASDDGVLQLLHKGVCRFFSSPQCLHYPKPHKYTVADEPVPCKLHLRSTEMVIMRPPAQQSSHPPLQRFSRKAEVCT